MANKNIHTKKYNQRKRELKINKNKDRCIALTKDDKQCSKKAVLNNLCILHYKSDDVKTIHEKDDIREIEE